MNFIFKNMFTRKNKLIRKVKRLRTAESLANDSTTIFLITTFGYRQNGEVLKNLIRDRTYEVYSGNFIEYQHFIGKNQTAIKIFEK